MRVALGGHLILRAIIVSIACAMFFVSGCASSGDPNEPVPLQSAEDAEDAAREEAETERAIAALRRMSEFLAVQENLRFVAETQYDAVQASGQKVEFGSQRRVNLHRPDRARVEVDHWDGEREIISFDRQRLSAAILDQRVYASIAYEGTVAEAFEHLITEYGVAAPLSDLLRKDLPDDVASRVVSARSLGQVAIAGVPCEHLAFHGERIDFQLFIQAGEEPAPIRFVIDYHDEPGRPQFRAQMHDWRWDPEPDDSIFRFTPQAGSQRIPFAELLDLLLGPEADRP
jgi:hypothetical protein